MIAISNWSRCLKFLGTPFSAVGLKGPAAAIFIEANFLLSR